MAIDATFQVENMLDIVDELEQLFSRHHEEAVTDKHGLKENPDWDQIQLLNSIGMVHCLTVRVNKKLVGYIVDIVTKSWHYKGLTISDTELLYVLPEYRKGTGIAKELVRKSEDCLRKLGIKKRYCTVKLKVAPFIEHLGYMPVEQRLSKWIGD